MEKSDSVNSGIHLEFYKSRIDFKPENANQKILLSRVRGFAGSLQKIWSEEPLKRKTIFEKKMHSG